MTTNGSLCINSMISCVFRKLLYTSTGGGAIIGMVEYREAF